MDTGLALNAVLNGLSVLLLAALLAYLVRENIRLRDQLRRSHEVVQDIAEAIAHKGKEDT